MADIMQHSREGSIVPDVLRAAALGPDGFFRSDPCSVAQATRTPRLELRHHRVGIHCGFDDHMHMIRPDVEFQDDPVTQPGMGFDRISHDRSSIGVENDRGMSEPASVLALSLLIRRKNRCRVHAMLPIHRPPRIAMEPCAIGRSCKKVRQRHGSRIPQHAPARSTCEAHQSTKRKRVSGHPQSARLGSLQHAPHRGSARFRSPRSVGRPHLLAQRALIDRETHPTPA